MPANKRKATQETALPSSKKTKKVGDSAAPPRRSTRAAPSKASAADPAVEKPEPSAPSKAKQTKVKAVIEESKPAVKGREKKKELSDKAKATPRKRAADFFDKEGKDEESDGGWDQLHQEEAKGKKKVVTKKHAAKDTKVVKKAKVDVAAKEKGKKQEVKKPEEAKPAAAPKKAKAPPASDDEISLHGDSDEEPGNALIHDGLDSEDDSDEEVDDQTSKLLKGFESSDEEEEEEDADVTVVNNRDFRNLTIPGDSKKLAERSNKKSTGSTPGYIYLGRIPHGFYENEMRAYFSQFGTLLRLRLSRNKKTGHSKHYAFLEFADEDVAKIVSDTMDNYLLFGHILQCKVIPRSEIKVDQLFKGANKRFKRVPWTDLHRRQLEKPRTVEEWNKLTKKEEGRRKKRNEKLKEMGIDYEFEQPVQYLTEGIVVPAEETIEETSAEAEPDNQVEDKKKSKKGKKRKVEDNHEKNDQRAEEKNNGEKSEKEKKRTEKKTETKAQKKEQEGNKDKGEKKQTEKKEKNVKAKAKPTPAVEKKAVDTAAPAAKKGAKKAKAKK